MVDFPKAWRIQPIQYPDYNRRPQAGRDSISSLGEIAPAIALLRGKPAHILAYQAVWELAGRRASSVRVSKQQLAQQFYCDPRTAEGWIRGLADVGLVEIFDTDRGAFDLYVNPPEIAGQPSRVEADPQTNLNFEAQSGETAQTPPGDFAQSSPDSKESPSTESVIRPTIPLKPEGQNRGTLRRAPLRPPW